MWFSVWAFGYIWCTYVELHTYFQGINLKDLYWVTNVKREGVINFSLQLFGQYNNNNIINIWKGETSFLLGNWRVLIWSLTLFLPRLRPQLAKFETSILIIPGKGNKFHVVPSDLIKVINGWLIIGMILSR